MHFVQARAVARRVQAAAVLAIGLCIAAPAVVAESRPADAPTIDRNWLLRENGARVVAFSSEFGAGWVAENLTPPREYFDASGKPIHDLIWSSGQGEPFPHWVTIDLGQARWLTTFVFNNALADEPDHPGISARKLELWVGDSADALQRVASFELERNRDGQSVQIEPVQARHVKFVVTSNWGHPWYTELGASFAFDDGSRPGDLAAELKKSGKVDLYGIYFDFGSATLRPESEGTLRRILAVHQREPAQKLLIEGHTDAVGTDAANDRLSLARAQAVVAALGRMGANTAMFEAAGRGAKQPVASNATDTGRARNRRVTVRLP